MYQIKILQNKEQKDTWKDFAKNFKPRWQDTRRNYILNGKSLETTLYELDTLASTKKKYQNILSKIKL